MQVQPYLFFDGRCEEALEFYGRALGAKVEMLMRYKENPEPPPPGMVPSCAEGGVLGVLPGIIGCIQTTEILKLALGKGSPLVGRLLLFNALDMKFRELKLRRDPQCPVCGEHPTITAYIDYVEFCSRRPTHA